MKKETQEEVSKETLEEVADLYSTDEKNCHPADSYIYKKAFIDGAKWQAKQMYTELESFINSKDKYYTFTWIELNNFLTNL